VAPIAAQAWRTGGHPDHDALGLIIGGLIFNVAGIAVAATGGQPYVYNIFPG
jgi:hypothetical protein